MFHSTSGFIVWVLGQVRLVDFICLTYGSVKSCYYSLLWDIFGSYVRFTHFHISFLFASAVVAVSYSLFNHTLAMRVYNEVMA